MYGGPRPCKFGADCRNFAQGNCRFLHDPNTRPTNNQPPPIGGSKNNGPFGGPYPGSKNVNNPFPNPNPNTGKYPTHNKNDNADVSNQLCRIFHLGL